MHVDVIKIGKYDPTLQGQYSRYDGYVLSASFKTQPDLVPETYSQLDNTAARVNGRRILHSTLERGVQTAKYLSQKTGVPTQPLDLLNEVPFAMDQMLTEEEFTAEGSNLVRQRFLERFADDTLLESRKSIEARVNGIIALLENSDDLPDSVVVISHSFFMKILQAHIEGYDIFNHPAELANVLPIDQKTFDFGQGFNFDLRRERGN